MNPLAEKAIYILIAGAFKLMGLLPYIIRNSLAIILGRLFYTIDKKHRLIVIQNLTRAFGKEKSQNEIRRLAKTMFENLGKIVFEIGRCDVQSKTDILKHTHLEGLSNLVAAHKKGKGILLLSAHFGNWEILRNSAVCIMKQVGFKSNIVVRPLDFPPFDLYIDKVRTRFGAKMLPLKKQTIVSILEALQKQEMICLLMDQNVDWYQGVFVDMFGELACTNKGLAMLAIATEAPVVPLYMVRQGNEFIAKCLPEIPLIKTGDPTKDLEINTERYNKSIESIVKSYPDQWFWIHNRWKTKPYCLWPKN